MSERAAVAETQIPRAPWSRRQGILVAILALALLRGILYTVIFPPWQHYDEPGHFEYLRLIAERYRLPQEGDYDLTMRQEIAASMEAANFWKGWQDPPTASQPGQPPPIGVNQLDHPPLYYLLQALMQQPIASQDVDTQLYCARLVSVLLYVVTVAGTYGLVAEAFPQRRWLPAAVAAFTALLPPLTDLMSAVNNDVGAIAAATLCLWAAMRVARRGPSPQRVAMALVAAGVCFATKATAGLVAMVTLLILAAILVPHRYRRLIGAGAILTITAALLVGFQWGTQAAGWYSDERPGAATRVKGAVPLGEWAFLLSEGDPERPRMLFQELPWTAGQRLRGRTVTAGAWIRVAEGDGNYAVLSLDDGFTLNWHRFEATSEWQFYAFTSTISVDTPGVSLSAIVPNQGAAREIYLDGLVLVDGEMPLKVSPQFETPQARRGQWGGRSITNLLRNGSAELSWPSLRSRLATISVFRYPAILIVQSLWDWTRTGWVYGPALSILFQSFWGRFGWNHVALPKVVFYPLILISAVGLLGAGLGMVRRIRAGTACRSERCHIWAILVVTSLASWGAAILRVHPAILTRFISWPVARYALVAIAPTATLLCLGLTEIVPQRWEREFAWAGLLGLIALDVIAVWTAIFPYYFG